MYKRLLTGLYLLGVCGLAAAAGSEQLYFIAQVAPTGSLSSPGQQSLGVYLRWDVVEGTLPPDLQRFRLERNDHLLLEAPAHHMMADAAIAELYQGPAQQRRLLESLSWLREQAAAEQPSIQITTANLAQQIRARTLSNPLWSTLASRVDFNIARARYRGYLDLDAEPGNNIYRLYGINATNQQVLLGQAVINTSNSSSVSAAADFRQVLLGQCDAPESGKDHGVVALTWDQGGNNPTDRYANSLSITGYDLYRSTLPLHGGTPPPLNIAQLAAQAGHDQSGTPILPNLERINQQPIMIHARPAGDPHYVQTMETAADIAAAGLKPGDRRAYYLVPRDFTGNYGPTVSLAVTVPDLRPPPPPWSIEVETHDAGAGRFNLVWDAVNLINYHRAHDDGRQFCNLDSARAENALRYVPAGKICGVDTEIEVKLGVDSYRVYRFDSHQAAASFKDSDGDGYSDANERAANPTANPPYSCDSNLKPPGGKSALLAASGYAARQLPDGRQQILFNDPYPAEHKGEVVWYRVASVSASGLVSPLSAPVRGHFPDRRLPPAPVLGQDIRLTTTGPESCDYDIRSINNVSGPPMTLDTTGHAHSVRFSCRLASDDYSVAFPLQAELPGSGFTPSATQCQHLLDACNDGSGEGGGASVHFLNRSGQPLNDFGGYASAAMLQSCQRVDTRLELYTRSCHSSRAVAAGDLLNTPPTLSVSSNQCIAVYREIDGKDYKIDTVCGGQNVVVDYGPSAYGQGDMVCLSAATQNDNARSSARTRLPCFSVVAANPKPAPPQPLELSFDGDHANIVWQLPEERVTATVLEWHQAGEDHRYTNTVPHPGARGGDPRQQQVDISPALAGDDWQQQWCVRARTIGQAAGGAQAGALSEWSPPLCALRLPRGQQPGQYLAWPEVPRPPIGATLEAFYLAADQVPALLVSEPVRIPQSCDAQIPLRCDPNDMQAGSCLDSSPDSLTCYSANQYGLADPICGPLREATAGQLNFIAYRQSRPLGGGVAKDFVQISPLIEGLNCSSQRQQRGGSVDIMAAIADPYLKMLRLAADAETNTRMVYIDRYPHVPGREYRYQFVYFSADGEIIETRRSEQWLEVSE